MTKGDDHQSDEYARARPAVAERLRALGLDVRYVRGHGDTLVRDDGREVLDFAGGFGTTLFGHNHPKLVAALRQALDEQRPFSSQMSWRDQAARLSLALGARIARDQGHAPRVLLYSTGAEAVEAALIWALADYSARARAAGQVGAPPVVIGVEGGYHGRSAGAASVSARLAGDLGARAVQLQTRFCPRNDVATLEAWCEELTVDGHCRVAAIIVEPVQGEGGVFPLDAAFLSSIRRVADARGFLVVADEIQSGLGRTGSFLASNNTGLSPDGILLGKALGGSLVKLSALAVRESRFTDSLPLVATGTFVDDDLSARVGLAALQLVDEAEVCSRCTRAGAALMEQLQAVATRHRAVVRDVRGRGLMLGVELGVPHPADEASPLLTLLADAGYLAAAVAGHLLHAHAVRTAPALSAMSVLRLQPSAFVDDESLARVAGALDETLGLLEQGDVARLLAHITGEVPQLKSRPRPRPAQRPDPADARVAFLAPLGVATDVRHLDLALAALSDTACERLMDRAGPLLPPLLVGHARVRSATGASVGVDIIGVPFTAAQVMAALREGRPQRIIDRVRDAAALARVGGARVIGFGGHTSIVAQLDTTWSDDVAWVSGNALTAAAAAQVAREGALRRGLPMRIGVVGAAGSIGALLAELLAPDAEEVLLVGRPRSVARLHSVAERVLGSARWRVSTELADLTTCSVIVTASNSPEPVVNAAHVARPALVVDVAVPGDADPGLRGLAGVTVLRGGAVRLPGGQTLGIAGLDLGDGHVHACLAETLLCGLGGLHDSALVGSPSAARAARLLELAHQHGFIVDEAPL